MLDTKGNKVIEPIPFAGLIELDVGFIPASLDRAIAIAASALLVKLTKQVSLIFCIL